MDDNIYICLSQSIVHIYKSKYINMYKYMYINVYVCI